MIKKPKFLPHVRCKQLCIGAAFSATVAALLCIAGQLFLRNLYRLLSFDQQFFTIFKQISESGTNMHSPILLLLLLLFPITFGLYLLWHRKTAGKILAITLGILAFALLLLLSILFTRVNRVMFLDVVLSLVPLLLSGAL